MSEIVQVAAKVYEQSIFGCAVLPAFKCIVFLPSPAAELHLSHATHASQLFDFMTVIKIYSKLVDLTAISEQITAAWQNTIFMIKFCQIALKKKIIK